MKASVTKEQVESIVADVWAINVSLLHTRTRRREVVEARQVAIYVFVDLLGVSNNQAAKYFGLDHATSCYARKSVLNLAGIDQLYRKKVDLVISRMGVSHPRQVVKILTTESIQTILEISDDLKSRHEYKNLSNKELSKVIFNETLKVTDTRQ